MQDRRHRQAAELLRRLQAEHPALKHFRPLDEAAVEASLVAAHPQVEPWLLRLALHVHVTSDAYLQGLSHGGALHRLDGTTAGEVDPETRHHARALLKHHRVRQKKRKEARSRGQKH
jgi:sRNA-binding protein